MGSVTRNFFGMKGIQPIIFLIYTNTLNTYELQNTISDVNPIVQSASITD